MRAEKNGVTGARTHILDGDPPIEVELKRSPRAQRFSLRVSRADGRVSLSLPVRAAEAAALDFLASREAWLRAHVAAAPTARTAGIGAVMPLEGRLCPVRAGTGRSARFDGAAITVPPGPRAGPRIKALFQALARERLAAAVDVHAAKLGRRPGRLTLRDTRSRWGSCTGRGDLMFSWRLIMAPPAVLDYVAAHEVAHLAHMDHSPRFWAQCARLCPGYAPHRAWLRREGPALLSWDFASRFDESRQTGQ